LFAQLQKAETVLSGTRIDVPSQEGTIDCYTFQPDRGDAAGQHAARQRWPTVILYMDAFGIRPNLGVMAQRLAAHGYFVVVPNLYHRAGTFAPFDPALVFSAGPERDRFKAMIMSINATMVMRDTALIIDTLRGIAAASTARMAAVGYCMGGGFALSAAGTFPERMVAAASFHGGSLATDKPDSPHRLASTMRGKIYVGAAETDPSFPADQQERLEQALRDAGVDYTIETYEHAKHGFAVTGHPVYDHDASERHWRVLLALLGETLG
jgi:carboxymethylenebutenolidase